jgi:hypothetical protein
MRSMFRPFAALLFAVMFALVAGTTLSGTAAANGGDPAKAWVIHAAPFASGSASVTVEVISGTTTLATIPDFTFAETTGAYVDLPSGTDLDLEVTPTGAPSPAITATVNLMADTYYSVAAIGGANGWPLELFPLADDVTAPAAGNFKIRIAHLAPFAATSAATEVSIRTQDGTVVGGLTNVPYKGVSPYLELPAGVYDLKVASPDGSTTIIEIPPLPLAEGNSYTAIAIGDGVNQTPTVILLQQRPGAPTAVTLSDLSTASTATPIVPVLVGLIAAGIVIMGAVALRRR